jgi:hypothetical protein
MVRIAILILYILNDWFVVSLLVSLVVARFILSSPIGNITITTISQLLVICNNERLLQIYAGVINFVKGVNNCNLFL